MTKMDISDDMVMSNQIKKREALNIIIYFPFSWCVVELPQFLTHYLWMSFIYMHRNAHIIWIKYLDLYPKCEQTCEHAGYSDKGIWAHIDKKKV